MNIAELRARMDQAQATRAELFAGWNENELLILAISSMLFADNPPAAVDQHIRTAPESIRRAMLYCLGSVALEVAVGKREARELNKQAGGT